jgi:hypothetical protein
MSTLDLELYQIDRLVGGLAQAEEPRPLGWIRGCLRPELMDTMHSRFIRGVIGS